MTIAEADVVLVHGAWHGAWCWDGVAAELERAGVRAATIDLPFTGLDDDVAAARQLIESTGDGTVVLGHSYGGEVIGRAAVDLPNVKRLVFLAAFQVERDDDTAAILAKYGSTLPDALQISDGAIMVDPTRVHDIFYGDTDDATSAALAARLRAMPLVAPTEAASEPAWKSVPSTYIVCTNDRAIPPDAQRWMAQRADEILEWPTDHSPFVTRPAALAQLLISYVR